MRWGSYVLLFPRCRSSVCSLGSQFHTSYLPVSMQFLSVIAHWKCKHCPEHIWLIYCMLCRSSSESGPPGIRRVTLTSTGQGTHKFLTKRMPAHSFCTSKGHLCLVESVPSFVHTQNFHWIDGPHLIRSTLAERSTYVDRHKWSEKFVIQRMSVGAFR